MTSEISTCKDKKALACNYLERTMFINQGALAYLHNTNPGNGNDRVQVRVRSRSGRWITKYEGVHNLHNFRFKTIPKGHVMYEQQCTDIAEELSTRGLHIHDDATYFAAWFNKTADEARAKKILANK